MGAWNVIKKRDALAFIAGVSALQHHSDSSSATRWRSPTDSFHEPGDVIKKRDAHFNHDIWHVRANWSSLKQDMRKRLLSGDYALSPAQVVSTTDHRFLVWSAQDTILLKALSLLLEKCIYPQLKETKRCYHLKGLGQKAAIRWANKQALDHRYVYRTDIKKYYASLDKHKLQSILSRWIKDPRILSLIWQYCDRVEEYGGDCYSPNKGIPRGGALSVVLGTLYLIEIDKAFLKKRHLVYLRYMDDLLIFCKSRYGLRRVVKEVYRLLEPLGLTLAMSKTYIGKVSNGVDFLGYRIGGVLTSTITISKPSVQRFCERLNRLYEQRATVARVKAYLTCWYRWVQGGLGQLRVTLPDSIHQLINNPGNLIKFLAVSPY